MAKRKYLGHVNPKYVKSYSSRIIRVDEENIKGYASFLKIEEVHSPLMAGKIYLYDDGYSELSFLPDNENWMLWAIYNNRGEIVEWYADITKENAVDEEGSPYCDDLYLDAALMPDGEIIVLDEDELKDAHDSGEVTRGEFNMAHEVLRELREQEILSVEYMEQLCSRLLKLFDKIG